ncbi:unnamed protein product, partial [Cyprideis torosa]
MQCKHYFDSNKSGLGLDLKTKEEFNVSLRVFTLNITVTSAEDREVQRYRGLWHGVWKIWREEGLRGWYRGFAPGLIGTSHGAIQFTTYERLKLWHNAQTGATSQAVQLPAGFYLMYAAMSKALASGLTYPYQVVRARQMDYHREKRSAIQVIKAIAQNEGVRGFYKG